MRLNVLSLYRASDTSSTTSGAYLVVRTRFRSHKISLYEQHIITDRTTKKNRNMDNTIMAVSSAMAVIIPVVHICHVRKYNKTRNMGDLILHSPIDYAWVTSRSQTSLLLPDHNGVLKIPEPSTKSPSTIYKITLYAFQNNIFKNMGTLLIRIFIPSASFTRKSIYNYKTHSVYFKKPDQDGLSWKFGTKTNVVSVTMHTRLPFVAESVLSRYEKLALKMCTDSERISLRSSTQLKGCDHCDWFVRTYQMEYEWPFAMPGACGIRQAQYGTPTPQTLSALVLQAALLCGFNEHEFTASNNQRHKTNAIEALAVLTATGYGYANGYKTEVMCTAKSMFTWLLHHMILSLIDTGRHKQSMVLYGK